MATQPKTADQLEAEEKKRKAEEEKKAEELKKARFNDPNLTDEERAKARNERLKLPPEETAEEKALRVAEEKRAEKSNTETPEEKQAREAKEEKLMRAAGGTMIREVLTNAQSPTGDEIVSIRELEEPTGAGDDAQPKKGDVKEKQTASGQVKK